MKTNRVCALKDVILSTEIEKRYFSKECAISARCYHPNIVKHLDAYYDAPTLTMVTELMDFGLDFILSASEDEFDEREISSICREVVLTNKDSQRP